jgi:hypothetical protein
MKPNNPINSIIKMKKLNVFVLLILMVAFPSRAQENVSNNLAYKVSKPFKVFDFDHNFYVTKNDEIVVIKFIRSQCIIQRFNTATPELIKENRYSEFFPNGFRIETFKEIAGEFYFFYSLNNKDKKAEEIYAQEVNFETAEFINPPKLILGSEGKPKSIKQTDYLHKDRTTVVSSYEFIQPKDKSNLLIKYVTFLNGREDSSIKINLIDKNLSSIYSKTLSYNIDKSSFILSNLIDTNGNFYFATKKISKGEKDDTYKIYLNTLKSNSNDLVTEELHLDTKFINELWIKDFNNEIICGGFTSDFDTSKKALFSLKKSVSNNSNGIIVFKSNADGKIIENFKIDIPEKILNFYKGQPSIGYVENIYMHDLELLKTGEIVIIGEQFISEMENNSGFGIYRDVVICKLSKNGELNFVKRLPKLQASANESQPFSFKTFYTDDFVYIPFIDNVKNLDVANTKVHDASGDLILSRISLKDGEISRKFILDIGISGNNLNKFSIDRFYKSDLNSFCFDAYKKDKEDVMVTVGF